MAVRAEEPELEIILSEFFFTDPANTERLRKLAAAKLTRLDENARPERRVI